MDLSILNNLPKELRTRILDGIILNANTKGRSFEKQSQKNQEKIIKRVVKEKLLSNEMNGKWYSRKANNKNGLLPSQMGFVKSSILKMPVDIQAHYIREQEKRAY
jgi:hypothetical protein|tara:strand:- start:489 stop:803 length:315 start_codon:yes stop_codon:yes gene_type:complete